MNCVRLSAEAIKPESGHHVCPKSKKVKETRSGSDLRGNLGPWRRVDGEYRHQKTACYGSGRTFDFLFSVALLNLEWWYVCIVGDVFEMSNVNYGF